MKIRSFQFFERLRYEISDNNFSLNLYFDILKDLGSGRFCCKVFREDMYRMRPSINDTDNSDEIIIVLDDYFEAMELKANSLEEIRIVIKEKIHEVFSGGFVTDD
jgi:hypothetical protein